MKTYIKNDFTFLIPFGIWLFLASLRSSLLFAYVEPYYVPLCLLCIGLICVREVFFLSSYKKQDIAFGAFAGLCALIALRLHEGTMMYSCICLFCARHTPFQKIAKACLIACIVNLVLIIGLSQAGVILDYVIESATRKDRHFLGYRYVLYGPAIYFNVVALLVYLRKRDMRWATYIGLFIINYVLYQFTDARLSFIFTCLLLFGSIVLKYGYEAINRLPIWRWLAVFSLLISMVVSIGCTLMYSPSNTFLVKVNDKLENRLVYGQNSLESIGVTVWGQEVSYVGNGLDIDGSRNTSGAYDYVDCFYLKCLEKYGIVFMAIAMSAYTWVLYRLKQRNCLTILIIFSLFALHGMIDDLMFNLFYNSFLLVLPTISFEQHD